MNDTLVRRAAGVFRNWMVSQGSQGVSEREAFVMKQISSSCKKIIQMQEWATRFFNGSINRVQIGPDGESYIGISHPSIYTSIATHMIPNIGEDVVSGVSTAIHSMKNLRKNSPIKPISLREAVEEVSVISNVWNEVKWRDKTLSVLVEDVILENDAIKLELGAFWVHLNLTYPHKGLSIEALGDNYSASGHAHPHVSDSKLCVGDGNDLISDALNQGRLEDYFRLIESILRTYNEGGAYEGAELHEWNEGDHEGEFYCEDCGGWVADEDTCYCEGCQSTYCETCNNYENGGCCVECDDWRCEECVTTCGGCQERLCKSGCGSSCDNCNGRNCSSCIKACTVCNDGEMCDECLSSCAYCGNQVCEECLTECGECGERCCNACVDASCNECNDKICKDCQTSCEECGTTMCCTCANKHECLLQEIAD